MILYFINGSYQKKKLMESDYADDIYDMLTAFFEEHKHFPRFLKCKRADDSLIINFESVTEHFLVDDASESDEEELSKYIAEYHR